MPDHCISSRELYLDICRSDLQRGAGNVMPSLNSIPIYAGVFNRIEAWDKQGQSVKPAVLNT